MATCNQCNLDMASKDTKSCVAADVEFPDGTKMPPVPYSGSIRGRCYDCNVADGGIHHPRCDMVRCPKCDGQLISCGCLDNEEEDDD
jgi:antirestriction protein